MGWLHKILTTRSSRKWDTGCLPRLSTPAAGPFLAILEPLREGWLVAQLAALHNSEQGTLQGGLDRGLEYQPFTRLPRFCWGSSSYKVEVRATRAVLVRGSCVRMHRAISQPGGRRTAWPWPEPGTQICPYILGQQHRSSSLLFLSSHLDWLPLLAHSQPGCQPSKGVAHSSSACYREL